MSAPHNKRKDEKYVNPRYSLRNRMRYAFDRTIASGTTTLVAWLAVLTTIMVGIAAVFITLGAVADGEDPSHYGESFWRALALAIAPEVPMDPGWEFRTVMLVVAILGILIVSTLIGVLTSGIESRLEELRRGRSLVLESDHTLILGWSSKITSILSELAVANENQEDPVVVVLADRDKVEMDEFIADSVGDLGNLRVVCRSGVPSQLDSLDLVNPKAARAVIVLRCKSEHPDADNMKIVLALRRMLGNPLPCPVVVEMVDKCNVDAVGRIDKKVIVVQSGELITRIVVQAARQPGLSKVYDKLLSFSGNEIYFQKHPTAYGRAFNEVSLQLEDAVLIGLRQFNGNLLLNPPGDHIIEKGSQLVVITQDDERVHWREVPIDPSQYSCDVAAGTQAQDAERAECVVVIGWNRWGHVLLDEFDELLPAKSDVKIIFNPELVNSPPDLERREFQIRPSIAHGDTTQRSVLESIDFTKYDHAVLLSCWDKQHFDDADNNSLLTLIHLHDIFKTNKLAVNITSEIIDSRNHELVRETGDLNDFIASEVLAGKVLVQLAENSKLVSIFDALLTAGGAELHLRVAKDYVPGVDSPTFAHMATVAMQRGEIAVGYLHGDETIMNPAKNEPLQFEDGDSLIVLAEE